jgi:hypothetical protein
VPDVHPVHALQKHLQAARLQAIEKLAANEGPVTPDALRDLAALQTALIAVREEIVAHAGKMGWGGAEELE